MFRKKSRPLSRDGLKLFNLAMTHRKGRLNRLVHYLFGSEYDDRLEEVLGKFRQSTVSLIKRRQNGRDLSRTLENGANNAVRLILEANSKHGVRQNFRFYTDVMRLANARGDHQTALLYWYALTHPYVMRLELKKPKRFTEAFERLRKEYGTDKTGHREHISTLRRTGYANDFLPSLDAVRSFRNFRGAPLDELNDLEATMDLFGMMLFLFRSDTVPFYEEQYDLEDLFEMSRRWKS